MEHEENNVSENVFIPTTNTRNENQLEYSHAMDIDKESSQDEFISELPVECLSSELNQLDPFLAICMDESTAEDNLDIPCTSTQESNNSAEQECSSLKQSPSLSCQKRKRHRSNVPPHIKALIGEANLRFARGDTETAEKICYEVIRQCPRASEAFLTLAQLLEAKDPDKSLQLYFMAAVTTRKDITLWTNTAERAVERNNINLGISCYNFAINADKENCTLHKKRICLLEKLENKNTLIKACVRYLALLMQKNDKELLEISLKLAILYSEANDYKKAIDTLDISFKKFPDMVTPEMVNIMLDLLINTENYTYCLDIFFQYCNIEIEVIIGEENCINIISCTVPDNIPIDFRVKFIMLPKL
ncbi:general transcription factor 3C polypeptide 3 [Agrilus planipennis]|uniref:General transcription factor 3C polypeptide 3 n=1 Tax=Agrilus planipennis TaxID=224129 RepID=A0A1W4XGD5_AGRPL|nr:general transcription factor 3C polypeptide 3 [Agrilus planipennis]